MIKRSLFIIVILISVSSLLSNFKVFQVNIEQYRLLGYLSVGAIQKMDKEYLDRISTNYPTLSQTVIPLKAITGTYWLQNDSVIKGLDLLHQANKDNPYLGFPDAMIAGFYEFLGVKDSFNFYAKSAHSKLPNAPQHYVLLSKLFLVAYDKKSPYLGIIKFNNFSKISNKLIPLGGINNKNLNQLKNVSCEGFAILSEVKKKPAKIFSRLF